MLRRLALTLAVASLARARNATRRALTAEIPIERFLLVSQPRSGSTWVLSKIATHACVLSRSENGHEAWSGSCKNAGCFEAYFRKPPGGALAKHLSAARKDGCPDGAPLLVGGKVWGTQIIAKAGLPPAVREYLVAKRVRVVIVNRLNALDHHISQRYIHETQTARPPPLSPANYPSRVD